MKMQLAFFSALASTTGFATPVHWFGGRDLDYWNEGKMVRGISKESRLRFDSGAEGLPITESIIRSTDFLPFDWQQYEDPLSPQFWDDGGNYVPPRPLRIVAANPTEENIAKYREWQRRKMEIITRVSHVLGTDVPTAQGAEASVGKNELPQHGSFEGPRRSEAQTSARNLDWSQVTATFIYRSSCPHCQREVGVIDELRKRGTKVIALQLSSDKEKPIVPQSFPLSNDEAARLNINVTPTLVLTVKGKSTRIEGYSSEDEITEEARKLF